MIMAKLKVSQVRKINHFLKEKGLLSKLDELLIANDMGEFEVVLIRLKPKEIGVTADFFPPKECPTGYEPREVCTPKGGCRWVCVKKY